MYKVKIPFKNKDKVKPFSWIYRMRELTNERHSLQRHSLLAIFQAEGTQYQMKIWVYTDE